MKPPKMIDNKKNGTVAEDLRLELTKDSKLSVMTAYFTIFAFAELKKELFFGAGNLSKADKALLSEAAEKITWNTA